MKLTVLLVGIVAIAGVGSAQERPEPEVVATIEGEPMYQVLPVGAIPAVDEPRFVTGAAAEAQMGPDEPVIAVILGGEARAYSLWQLDAHEIVNDTIGGSAIAVTW